MASPSSSATDATDAPLHEFLDMLDNEPMPMPALPTRHMRSRTRNPDISSDSTDYLMASFFLRQPRSPAINPEIPAPMLQNISIKFRDLAKISARANVQTDGAQGYHSEDLVHAYLEVLGGFERLQDALRDLDDPELESVLVHQRTFNGSSGTYGSSGWL
ncbi:hypothetical protein C2E23DRAFT_879960 [Lenzites betulinus]|nr:hypothetical protein C2E23DRAFT_879960 [Lenzites betulinus]